MNYITEYLQEATDIIAKLDKNQILKAVDILVKIRETQGRLFILGVGGSAGNASHAVCDFRKIANMEAYCPTDNVSELTARTNDDGWASVLSGWLKVSRLRAGDALLIFSVGGGNVEKNVSPNLVGAIQLAKKVGAQVIGIVGRDGGYTAQAADACILIPSANHANTTFHAEAFQGLVWHMLVGHPKLKNSLTKWESVIASESQSCIS